MVLPLRAKEVPLANSAFRLLACFTLILTRTTLTDCLLPGAISGFNGDDRSVSNQLSLAFNNDILIHHCGIDRNSLIGYDVKSYVLR